MQVEVGVSDIMNHLDHRAAKEAFVTGLCGSSKLEIFALVSVLSTSVVICEGLKRFLPLKAGLTRYLVELLVVVYPHIILCTGALPLWPTCACCCLLAAVCVLTSVIRPGPGGPGGSSRLEDLVGRRKSFVSAFRGALMAATCLCILAVDFRAFPRRYAKTEYFGTGYMDVGVGGVVFAAGLVGSAGVPYSGAGAGGRGGGGQAGPAWRPKPVWQRLYDGLRGAAACWLFGLGRLLTTRAVDYQVHVGEYGVHWNFFHTIALVALLGQVVAVPPAALLPAAVGVTAAHQLALSAGGLGPWVMSPHRGPDLLSLNKEGLVSCAGFWALYLWGAALAHLLHVTLQPTARHLRGCTGGGGGGGGGWDQRQPNENKELLCTDGRDRVSGSLDSKDDGGSGSSSGSRERRKMTHGTAIGVAATATAAAAAAPLLRWWLQLVGLDLVLWAAVGLLEARVEPVSRRSCNAAYVVWIVAQFLWGLLPLALCQGLEAAAAAAAPATVIATSAAAGHPSQGMGDDGGGAATAAAAAAPAVAGRIAANCSCCGDSSRNERAQAEARTAGPGGPGRETAAAADESHLTRDTCRTTTTTSSSIGGSSIGGSSTTSSGIGGSSIGGSRTCTGGPRARGSGGAGSPVLAEVPGSARSLDGWGPHVLQAINRNQLAVFLLANLLTGAVNLSVDTLQVEDWPARALLGGYMTLVCAAAVALDARGWRLKL